MSRTKGKGYRKTFFLNGNLNLFFFFFSHAHFELGVFKDNASITFMTEPYNQILVVNTSLR